MNTILNAIKLSEVQKEIVSATLTVVGSLWLFIECFKVLSV